MSIGKLLKSIVLLLLILPLLAALGIYWYAANDRANPYPVDWNQSELANLSVPTFSNQSIDFAPTFDVTRTLPFAASAIIDIDNDGTEEVFIGGGSDQQDAFFQFENGSFVDISDATGWNKDTPDKTFSAVSLDFDKDGDNDLLVSRQSGVYLYNNNQATFSAQKLALQLDNETVPLSVAVGDINGDGLFDLYVCGYIAREFVQGETIFNKPYGGVSGLFLNSGNNEFKDITESAGMLYQHNTFQAMFVDVDQDNLADLVVAHDTGQIKTWKNNGDLSFSDTPNPSSDVFAYPMGIATTDLRNDGLPDFFFSNVGNTVPNALIRGDLTDDQQLNKSWMLFDNQGEFKFNDTAQTAQVADFEFSWGAIFEDFNLDGLDDLVVSENYEGWPIHKLPFLRLDGRFLLQAESGRFIAAGNKAGVSNRAYGIAPLSADFNNDGYPDLIHINLKGAQNVFINNGGDNGYLKVKLPNTVESIGAQISVELDNNTTLVRNFVVGEGLVSDQSHVLIFGLGKNRARKVSVETLGGQSIINDGDFRNEQIDVAFGS